MTVESMAKLSWELDFKRRRLRELLAHRDSIPYHLVEVRLWHCELLTWRLWEMAKKEQKKDAVRAEFIGFFNLELDAQQKTDCKEWLQNDEQIGIEIEQAIASGYKFTISKDGRTDGYQATIQQVIKGEPNAGYCMSAFAKHWYLALGVLMYKHAVVLKYVWNAKEPLKNSEDFG